MYTYVPTYIYFVPLHSFPDAGTAKPLFLFMILSFMRSERVRSKFGCACLCVHTLYVYGRLGSSYFLLDNFDDCPGVVYVCAHRAKAGMVLLVLLWIHFKLVRTLIWNRQQTSRWYVVRCGLVNKKPFLDVLRTGYVRNGLMMMQMNKHLNHAYY